MNEEKLDLILTVVSELKGGVDKLDSRMDSLEKEFKDFKRQVMQALKSLSSRLETLEKQMFSIGTELKNEIKGIRDEIELLENKLMVEQAENIKYHLKVKSLEARITKLEEKNKLAA